MQLVMYLSIIAIFWFGGNMIVNESLLTGELISFISYLSQVLFSLMMISMIFVMLVISRASVQRIVEVLDAEVDLKDCIEVENEKTKTLHIKDGSIQFSEVFFSYSNKKDKCILKDINIEIDSGMTVGIIGSTGSSKTSLVQLIPRLYDVLSGAVKVGGIDVRDIPLKELRGQVAMVLQKNTLFSGTIKENLKWGNENASDAEIKKVCQIAQADDFVSNFPEGYETKLGQGGVNLSGGQKQRLSIARALLKKPKILILDDSTSAVDTATDKAIRSALKEGFADITKIIIAQRIDSIKESDLILVMDEGKLSAQGRHEDLLEKSAIYREVYESQQAGALIDLDEEE
jgi:ATP-binding cassette subfamily B protein